MHKGATCAAPALKPEASAWKSPEPMCPMYSASYVEPQPKPLWILQVPSALGAAPCQTVLCPQFAAVLPKPLSIRQQVSMHLASQVPFAPLRKLQAA